MYNTVTALGIYFSCAFYIADDVNSEFYFPDAAQFGLRGDPSAR